MPQDNPSQQSNQSGQGRGRHAPVDLTALAVRSFGRVCNINLSAARVIMQTQARAASAIGMPDWSGLFNTVDQSTRDVFSTSAEQLVSNAQRANEAAAELQRELGRVVESQTVTVADTLKHGLEELGSHANEGLNQLVQTTREQADRAEEAAASMKQEMDDQSQRFEQQASSPEDDRQGDLLSPSGVDTETQDDLESLEAEITQSSGSKKRRGKGG